MVQGGGGASVSGEIYERELEGLLIWCRWASMARCRRFKSAWPSLLTLMCLHRFSPPTDQSSSTLHRPFTRGRVLRSGAKTRKGRGAAAPSSAMVRMSTQLRAILWKNVLLKRRHWVSTFFEVREVVGVETYRKGRLDEVTALPRSQRPSTRPRSSHGVCSTRHVVFDGRCYRPSLPELHTFYRHFFVYSQGTSFIFVFVGPCT